MIRTYSEDHADALTTALDAEMREEVGNEQLGKMGGTAKIEEDGAERNPVEMCPCSAS